MVSLSLDFYVLHFNYIYIYTYIYPMSDIGDVGLGEDCEDVLEDVQ